MPNFKQTKSAMRASKRLAARNAKQTQNSGNFLGYAQNLVLNGSQPAAADSILSNPNASHPKEKLEVYKQAMNRVRYVMHAVNNHHFLKVAPPSLTALGLAEGGQHLDVFTDITRGWAWVKNELSNASLASMVQKAAGYVIHRIADLYFLGAKVINFTGGVAVHVEAPVVQELATTHVVNATYSETMADSRLVSAREEIHKVATMFGLEADFLTALLQSTVKLKSIGAMEFTSLDSVNLTSPKVVIGSVPGGSEISVEPSSAAMYGLTEIDIRSDLAVRIRAGLTHVDLSPGNLLVTTGTQTVRLDSSGILLKNGSQEIKLGLDRIDLNPLVPTPVIDPPPAAHVPKQTKPLVVPPGVPIDRACSFTSSDGVEQYSGVNPIPFKLPD